METTVKDDQAFINQIYDYAANMLVHENKTAYEVEAALVAKGLDEHSAIIVVQNLENQIHNAHKEAANKDMLHGALWCIGGTIATLAHIGFIFWGAILFGGIQFFKGLINSMK